MVSITIQGGVGNLRAAHAIASMNPEAEVEETAGWIRITAPTRLVVDRTVIENALDKDIRTATFHSFAFNREGRVAEMSEDQIVIEEPTEDVRLLFRFRDIELRRATEKMARRLGIRLTPLINNAISAYLEQLRREEG